MDLSQFGSADCPLRASQIPKFMQCPWSVAMQALQLAEDTSGPAADTGSAVHFAAQLFHGEINGDARLAVAGMRMALQRFPLADLASAEDQFLRYARDKRNQVKPLAVELKIRLEVQATESDPTQAPIVIHGTCDQVRAAAGGVEVWDIKTSGLDGDVILDTHAFQLAAYALGVQGALGKRVVRVGIIRTKDYTKRSEGPVFWEASWSLLDAGEMMASVALAVAEVRKYAIRHAPGSHCKWCPAGGVAACTGELRRYRNP